MSEPTDKVGTCGNDLYNLGISSVLYTSFNQLNISTPVLNEEEESVNAISINLNNFNEISMLNTSPSSGNLSKPDPSLSKEREVENTCISNFFEPSYFDSSINETENNNENYDPFSTLKNIRISFINQLIIGQLNINSIRNKFEALKYIVSGNLDILIITESKLDSSFPLNQFSMDGYYPPFRAARTGNGGGVIIYVRDDIPCILLKAHPSPTNFEGTLLEINLNKSKWLLFGSKNPKLENTGNFVKTLGLVLDFYMSKYDNFLLLGDFNSEMNDNDMREFSDTYNLKNLITNPTFFKNPSKPSCIDLILTNRHGNFLNSKVIATRLCDHHKLPLQL